MPRTSQAPYLFGARQLQYGIPACLGDRPSAGRDLLDSGTRPGHPEEDVVRAMICPRYGPPEVLQLTEVEKPTPKDKEILIRVHAATVTQGDCEVRGFKIPLFLWLPVRLALGITKPRRAILGQEVSGRIEAIGAGVTDRKPGEAVFGPTGLRLGAYADYVCLPTRLPLTIKPDDVSYDEAAAITVGGTNALHFLRKVGLGQGETILINGAGGSIGTCGVQLAKHHGAEVTAVDSGPKLDMLRSIGADHVIDYTKQDFWRSGERYDVVFDIIGKAPFSGCVRSLNSKGRYILANPRVLPMLRAVWTTWTTRKRVVFAFAEERREDLDLLAQMVGEGTLSIVIDKRYPLEQLVEANQYVEGGHKKGNVVITVSA